MNKETKAIINYYKNYLIKKNKNIDEIVKDLEIKKSISNYEFNVNKELNKLERLSKEYKLYDSDYNQYMICMGKFAVALERIFELNIDEKYNKDFKQSFISIHQRFEELEQANIMKDVYIWKYISR